MIKQILSWADEYDSDMETEWITYNNNKVDNNIKKINYSYK